MILALTILFWCAVSVGVVSLVWLWFAYGAAIRAMDADEE